MKIGAYDTTGWTEEQRAELRTLLDDEATAIKKRSAVQAADEAARTDPLAILAAKRAAAEEAKFAAEYAERRAIGEKAFLAARAKHGRFGVGRINMKPGDVIVIRRLSEQEAEENNRLLAQAAEDSAKAKNTQPSKDMTEHVVKGMVESPDFSRVQELAAEFPTTWKDIIRTQGQLLDGEEAGAGPSPFG